MNSHAIPPAVIADQHAASDPAVSAWVSANAGSGKTHVLAQRVIRLLLDGTNPSKILCLTFTKAAAANMANRIFETLGQWIELDDTDLDAAIRETGAKSGGVRQREKARRLFASALETPGGLKVQTIHGFCTRLLQQFPFEANVAARFNVIEEPEQAQLLEDIRRNVLMEASRAPDGPLGQALATVISLASDMQFQIALQEAIAERGAILAWLSEAGGLEPAFAKLSSALGVQSGDTIQSVEAEILDGPHFPSSQWAAAANVFATGSKNDQSQARRLADAARVAGAARLDAYLAVFFTGDNELRGQFITKGLAQRNQALAQCLDDESVRVESLCERRRAVITRDRTMALLTIALEVIHRYAIEKNRRRRLDYDDLILRTREMLDRVDSSWVHYKLDLGIDHLLIDEAQDTSPQQWDIIKRFVAEFTAGAGARSGVRRSIFAVGDDKQSIFSFQDAAPEAFAEMRRYFESAHAEAGLPFRPIPFKYSFRSAPVVLNAVDVVFQQPEAHAGLTVDPAPTVHEAVRAAAPGLVELWPLVEPDDQPDVEPWDAPFDTRSETSPRVKLARQIARAIKSWIGRDLVGDGDKRRPVRAGDILVLVRQRGALFEATIRAIKTAGIPVAGADRLVLTEHIAVMDLLVLADAILLPTDDLALATILKSPLFELSEDELFGLAHGRKGSLIARLREQRPNIAARLDDLAAMARRLSPFAFYAELLGHGGVRKAFLSHFGPEANDALDEFLNLALSYELRETPSLQGFVAWLRTASAEVKRDMELARDEVRVMTVHGAKGLEAPILVLADTTTEPAGPAQYQPRLLSLQPQSAPPGAEAHPVWVPTKKDDTAVTAAARSAAINAAENEHCRLLYVAMTRAADRLVVCGSVGERGAPAGCWYQLVEQGLTASGLLSEAPADFGDGTVKRFQKAAPDIGTPTQAASGVAAPAIARPDWLTKNVAPDALRAEAIRPSGFVDDPPLGEPYRSGEARQRALLRGNIVHRLMQSLPDIPAAKRADAARHFIARQKADFNEAERGEIAARALAILNDPKFAGLFVPGSRAEVPLVGRYGGRAVNGVIDRLAVTSDAVLIADYKTNRPAPANLDEIRTKHRGYITQLALYRALLMRLYADRPVRAALVWTDLPSLSEIPPETMDEALRNLTSL